MENERTALKAFLEKSELSLATISRGTNIDRSQLSRYVHGHEDLSFKQKSRIIEYIKCYRERWIDPIA